MNTSLDEQINTIDSLAEHRILRGSPENYRASIEFKGLAFQRDRNLASMTYEVKRARATFDPNLAGGNGGWRCPVGTRYGGQITDRFGRGCGWGVARRLANTITDTGERLEGALDRRRGRRVERRNERVVRRIGKPAERIARRASNGVDRLTERDRRITPRTRRGDGAPERMDRTANEVLEGSFLANRRARRAARRTQEQARQVEGPRSRRQRRGDGVPERMDEAARDVLEGNFLERRRKRRQTNRQRRERAQVERTTPSGGNRRPSGPTTPAGTTPRPTRRRGPRVDIGEEGSDRRQRAIDALANEKTSVNDYWKRRLGGRPVTKQNIRDYVAERENRRGVNPAYLNTLRARERDHSILNGQKPERKIDDLSPGSRKRINERLNVPKKDKTPEAPKKPEAPEAPKKPKPEAPEPEIPASPRTSTRRIVGIEDVTDDPNERRRIQQEAAAENAAINRNYARFRERHISRDDDAALERIQNLLTNEHDRLGRIADDKKKPAEERYRAREKMRAIQDQKMRTAEARQKILERRRAAQEAANAPEAPSGPRTPRTPETGRRVNTFGIEKEERAKLDRFAESDRNARDNQRREIERLISANENPDSLLARRLTEADELLSDYERDLGDDNADAPDRYIAQQSIDDLRSHRDALKAIRDRRTGPAATPTQPQAPAAPTAPEGPELLVPDEAKQKELRQKFKEKKDAILKRRQKTIGDYMKSRYGSGDAPWKNREKNPDIAGLSALLDDANGQDQQKKAAAIAKLTEWAKGIYELPEFEGKDGTKFKTAVQIGVSRDGISINGNIQSYDSRLQSWRNIGEISRTLHIRKLDRDGNPVADFKPYVSNGLLKMRGNKNSGFASIYNPHAFTWLKASGFDHAKVGTAWDGKFVWGKMGYRESSAKSRALANKLEAEVKKIREGGRSSVVNKRDAEVIAALIDEARKRNFDIRAPQHAEYLMAMSNRDNARVKSWFTRNAPFDGGSFFFDEIADDPRS